MKFSVIPKLFVFNDWAEFTPEDREQRLLNKARIPDIARYILDNEEGYLFSSITASFKGEVQFQSLNGDGLGLLSMSLANASLLINDGQHRVEGIKEALKQDPTLADEELSVLLIHYGGKEESQQVYSDLNQHVVKSAKSLNILFEHREMLARITKRVINDVPVFEDYVEKDAASVPARSPKLFALNAIHEANKELLHAEMYPIGEMVEVPDEDALVTSASGYWDAVSEGMLTWTTVKSGHVRAMDIRQGHISAHNTVIRSLGAVGSDLLKLDKWEEKLLRLQLIDWRKTNEDWQDVCMMGISVLSRKQSKMALQAYIKMYLELPLTEAETRALPEEFRIDLAKRIKELDDDV